MSGGARIKLSGSFDLPIPREPAFRLFSARGEQLWVRGWQPEFMTEVDDDMEVGTVFRTYDDQQRVTTWVVTACKPGESIRYARVADGRSVGLVDVHAEDHGAGCSITVTYDLTSDANAALDLRKFAETYAPFLDSWRSAILRYVDAEGRHP